MRKFYFLILFPAFIVTLSGPCRYKTIQIPSPAYNLFTGGSTAGTASNGTQKASYTGAINSTTL